MALQFATEQLKDDSEIVLKAIQENGMALKFASERLKDDPEIVLKAVQKYGGALEFASERLKDDAEIVLKAVQKYGGALEFASKRLKDDKEFVLAAIQENGMALQFATEQLKDDSEIVLKAIQENGMAFKFASERLKDDPEIIRIFIEKNPTTTRDVLPPLPSLSRQISRGATNQAGEGVCGYHAFSKIILKNIFELLHPFHVTKEYTYHQCNKFLNTTTTKETIPHLNKNCSKDGYLKILLFLHLFFLYKTYIVTAEGRPAGWLECNQTNVIYPHLYKTSTIPGINELQQQDLTNVLTTMKDLSSIMNIRLITFRFTPTLELIQKITNEQLYIMLRIADSKSYGQHAAHFVVIVGTKNQEILFKNSWGDERIFRFILGIPFALGFYVYDTTSDCVIVLPVEGDKDETITDMSLLDNYLVRYRKLKQKLSTMP
jgi:hypothetical protein